MEMIFQGSVDNFKEKMLDIFPELVEAYQGSDLENYVDEDDEEVVMEILESIFAYVKTLGKKYWNTKTMLKQCFHMITSKEYQYLFAIDGKENKEKYDLVVSDDYMKTAARWLEYYYRVYEQPHKNKTETAAVVMWLKRVIHHDKVRMTKVTPTKKNDSVPFPVRLYKHTEQYVIGQPELKKLALAIHRYVNLGIRDVVLIKGPTGSGKNYAVEIMTQFEQIRDSMTVLMWDLSQVTPSGFSGSNMKDILTAFEKKCKEEGTSTNRGIIVLNECDKLMQPNTDSHGEDVNAITQQQLLTMLEGKFAEKSVDTSNILFILMGAFSRVDAMVEERKQKNNFGFGNNKKEYEDACMKQATLRNDIIEQGAQRELIGRVSTILELRKLEAEDMKKIILHPSTGAIHKKIEEFKDMGMQLEFTEGVIDLIVEAIMKENLGARSVNNIVNELVDKYQFDMFEHGYTKMIVHEGMLLQGDLPKFEGGDVYEKNA